MTVFTHAELLKRELTPNQLPVIMKFVEVSQLMRVLPWINWGQSIYPYTRQTSLPSVATRAVGETYTHSEGQLDPNVEYLRALGGISTFDQYQLTLGGRGRQAMEAEAFTEAVIKEFERLFFKGDSITEPREFSGLQKRCRLDSHETQASAANDGSLTPLSIEKSLDCRREVANPTHWLMGQVIHDKIVAAAHNTSFGGYITRERNEIGAMITTFCDLPIVRIGRDIDDVDILGFTETTNDAGSSAATSIYCVSLGRNGLHGVQGNLPQARVLPVNTTNGVQQNTVIDWYPTIVPEHIRCMQRLSDIQNAALTLDAT